jgi:Rrf2 family iron-sulfur cluster assembly transcriptional regulator
MVTQTARYALRILGYLVDHPGQRVQGREIAAATGIPASYLSKILSHLRKRGYVDGRKGWGGGFLLCDKAFSTPLAEVLDLFEGTMVAGQRCIFELRDCDAQNPCPLHSHWERVRGEYNGMLSRLSVRDLKARALTAIFPNQQISTCFKHLRGRENEPGH